MPQHLHSFVNFPLSRLLSAHRIYSIVTMSSPRPITIAIIGAGIGGITLAIAISKHNPDLHLTLFESRAEFSEIGAGVGKFVVPPSTLVARTYIIRFRTQCDTGNAAHLNGSRSRSRQSQNAKLMARERSHLVRPSLWDGTSSWRDDR